MEDDDSCGDIGGHKNKGKNIPNPLKQEQQRRAANPPAPIIEDVIEEPEREFGDKSVLHFDWTATHMDLFGTIVEQKEDDCWARVLRKILEFSYNRDIESIANRKTLSMDGLIRHILAARENHALRGQVEDLAVPSLKRAIQFIRDIGLEKDFGRNEGSSTFEVKGKFRSETNANSDRIRDLLERKGPIGIYVHMEAEFCLLTNGIYSLNIPNKEVIAKCKRRVLVLVAS